MTAITEVPKLVTVFGGSGFVGRYVVRALAKRGYRVRVACRRPELAFHLQPLGNVGQIQAVQANVRVPWSVERAVAGADHAVNLVGILHETGKQKFTAVQEAGARAVAEAARAAGIGLTHGSAIGADPASRSLYAQSKARGEKAALESVKDAVIFRPSIIFGPEDGFYNRFAGMARLSPMLPLIGGGTTLFQPVYVGDVAEAMARSVDGKVAAAHLRARRTGSDDLPRLHGGNAGDHRPRAPAGTIPWWLAELQASILGMFPNPLLTPDQVTLLRTTMSFPSGRTATAARFAALGIRPEDDRRNPADLSLALSSGRPVHAQDAGLSGAGLDIIAAWLPQGLGSAPAALLIVASFFTSALTAAFGLGGGVAMLALMGLFVPVAPLIPVHGAVQLGSNSGRAWHQRANVRMDVAVPFIAGSIVGAIAGAFIVVQLPDAVLKLVLGTFIIAVTWTKIPGIETLGRAGLALASAVLALTTMFVGATGPLLSSVFAQIFPNDRKALVATHGAP